MKYLLLAFLSCSAFAHNHEAKDHAFKDGPCAQDRQTHCANVEPGKGAILKCMKENEAKLSAECKTFLSEKKEHMKDVKESCKEDSEKLCSGMKKKALMKCLIKKKDELSETCKTAIEEMKAHKKGH